MFTRLKEDIDTIMLRDPAARSRLEVLTCYPGCTPWCFTAWPMRAGEVDFTGWGAGSRTGRAF
jgi:serine acetyltransferase